MHSKSQTMKTFLRFIFLLNIYYCVLANKASEKFWLENLNSYTPFSDHEEHYDIERPCNVHDLNCIRRFFAHYSGCSPVYGPAPDPFIVKNLPLELPHCNMTVALYDVQVKGLNSGRIKEFHLNRKSGTLVLEVEFEQLVVYTPHTVATYHFKGREATELSDYSIVEFNNLSLTLTTQNDRHNNNYRSHVYAFISDANPKFKFGPNIVGTKDPTLLWINSKWTGDMAMSVREAFLAQGPVYMSAFLEYLVCDFKRI